jgi:hypothetical protein
MKNNGGFYIDREKKLNNKNIYKNFAEGKMIFIKGGLILRWENYLSKSN